MVPSADSLAVAVRWFFPFIHLDQRQHGWIVVLLSYLLLSLLSYLLSLLYSYSLSLVAVLVVVGCCTRCPCRTRTRTRTRSRSRTRCRCLPWLLSLSYSFLLPLLSVRCLVYSFLLLFFLLLSLDVGCCNLYICAFVHSVYYNQFHVTYHYWCAGDRTFHMK